MIARSSLGTKDEDARHDVFFRIVLQIKVIFHDFQQVEQLTLVCVKTLDLNVKDRIRRNDDSRRLFDIFCKIDLVLMLCLADIGKQAPIVEMRCEIVQLFRIAAPLRSDCLVDNLGKARIGDLKPASDRDPVRLIIETFRIKMVEILQNVLFQKIRMQFSHTVRAVRPDDCKVCHMHDAVVHDARAGNQVGLCSFGKFKRIAPVNFRNDLHDARLHAFNQRNRPFFKRFRHDCVVRVAHRLDGLIKGLVPAHLFIVKQNAHKFSDAHCGMSIIDVHGNMI